MYSAIGEPFCKTLVLYSDVGKVLAWRVDAGIVIDAVLVFSVANCNDGEVLLM